MSGTSGKFALVNISTSLACVGVCSNASGAIDLVGYGAANDSAGGIPTGVLGNSTSVQRTLSPFANTGNYAANFTVAAPTPKAAPTGRGDAAG